jgi:hypothetical protein
VFAFENSDFGGRSLVLNGGAAAGGADGHYPLFLDVARGLKPPAHWNDRISSLRIVDGRSKKARDAAEHGSGAANEITLFENSNYGGASLRLEIGDEIRDLTAVTRGDRESPSPLSANP